MRGRPNSERSMSGLRKNGNGHPTEWRGLRVDICKELSALKAGADEMQKSFGKKLCKFFNRKRPVRQNRSFVAASKLAKRSANQNLPYNLFYFFNFISRLA